MSILTSALDIANKITKSMKLQAPITFERYLSGEGYGTESYGSTIPLTAVLEYKQRQVRAVGGELVLSTATLTLLDVTAVVAATPAIVNGGKAGWVFVKDRITLADGSKPAILNVGGFVDGGSGYLIPTEVYLG